MGEVVKCSAYADGRNVGDVPVPEVSEVLREGDRFVWIGVHDPDAPLMHQLQEEFGLHELAVEDALRAHQRPKVEEYGDALFIVLRTARLCDDGAVEIGETDLFVGPRYVVSIRHGESASYTPVRARIEASPELLKKGPGFVVYAIMDFVVDQYFPVVDALEDRLEALEDTLFEGSLDRETTQRLYALKRELVSVKRAISPLLEVCNRLIRFDTSLVPEDVRVYVRDVYDHVVRLNESIDNQRELLTTALEANLSLIAVRQNEVMKRLAAWAAIFAVPTMVAGIYGMNFEFMPELHWRYGYAFAWTAILGGVGALFAWFKRDGWL
jgi:magnesium transporter